MIFESDLVTQSYKKIKYYHWAKFSKLIKKNYNFCFSSVRSNATSKWTEEEDKVNEVIVNNLQIIV